MITEEQLKSIGVINTWDILKKFGTKTDDVACCFYSTRTGRYAHTNVFSPSHRTDPESHWQNYGQKSFSGKRKDSMTQALKWASQKYGITEWITCPVCRSDKIPKSVLDRMLLALSPTIIPHNESPTMLRDPASKTNHS